MTRLPVHPRWRSPRAIGHRWLTVGIRLPVGILNSRRRNSRLCIRIRLPILRGLRVGIRLCIGIRLPVRIGLTIRTRRRSRHGSPRMSIRIGCPRVSIRIRRRKRALIRVHRILPPARGIRVAPQIIGRGRCHRLGPVKHVAVGVSRLAPGRLRGGRCGLRAPRHPGIHARIPAGSEVFSTRAGGRQTVRIRRGSRRCRCHRCRG